MKPKELSNETLAAILRAICSTGICPTQYEKDYLIEAARRLEMISNDKIQGSDKG